jgi:translation initiation factor IF-2
LPAKKIRITELAKELGMTNKETVSLCTDMGIDVKSSSSSIEDAQADRVRRRAEREGLKRDVQPEEPKPAKKAVAKKVATPKATAEKKPAEKKPAPKKAAAKKAAATTSDDESVTEIPVETVAPETTPVARSARTVTDSCRTTHSCC